jgi:TPP-dependent pyruvate/acetoin dehydrogenase alpha subunit
MHLGDIAVGMIPSLAIVGASATIAPGLGLAFKLQKSDRVGVAIFGDGAANEGAFHEGLNFAAVKKLPVLFICENNLYGASTPYSEASLVTDIAERGSAYGMPGVIVDGMDVLAVYDVVSEAAARARAGDGPSLIECKTYRFAGHSRSDAKKYRPDGEEEQWKERDPITVLGKSLLANNEATQSDLDEMAAKALAVIEDAIEYADAAEPSGPEDVFNGLFASPPPSFSPEGVHNG